MSRRPIKGSAGSRSRVPVTSDDVLRAISGFYPTPGGVVDMLLERAGPVTRGDRVLEPSAGRGDIADRLRALGARTVVVEPHPVLAEILRAKGHDLFSKRFEEYVADGPFDKVVMNPPFADALDMEHIEKAFSLLRPGGVLVSLMADGGEDATGSQKARFARWLLETPTIARLCVERLDGRLLSAPDVFRPSTVPVRLLTLHRAP